MESAGILRASPRYLNSAQTTRQNTAVSPRALGDAAVSPRALGDTVVRCICDTAVSPRALGDAAHDLRPPPRVLLEQVLARRGRQSHSRADIHLDVLGDSCNRMYL